MKILPSFLVTTLLFGTATLASAKPVRIPDEKPTHSERLVVRFDMIDTDDDGLISRTEFTAHHKARMDKREDRKDRREDRKDRREDRKDAREDKQDAREDVREERQETKAQKQAAKKAAKKAKQAAKKAAKQAAKPAKPAQAV